MSTLRPPDRRVLLLAALAACAGAPSHAQALDLATLMQRMAQRKSGESRFTEERIVSGLDSPLNSSGTLSFTAPDRFARHTLHPTKESMEVQGRTLLLKRGGRTRQMEMDSIPEVAALLDAMRATLTGDLPVLKKLFRADLSGSDAKWVLRLSPLDERLQRQVRQIELVGVASDLRSIALQMSNGDRSLMLIDPLPPAAASAPK